MHDKLVYDDSSLYHICNEELGTNNVRDHCHLFGKFRGAPHEVCNLKCKVTKFTTYLLKHWEIAKEKFRAYEIMKKTTFLSRNRLSLTNL